MVTLEGISLPNDIQWADEFVGFGVGQVVTPTLTGAIVVEESLQAAGRPITLQSGDGSWTIRAVVEQIAALCAVPLADNQSLTLSWHGTDYQVIFDRSRGSAFEANEVLRVAAPNQGAGHFYLITINLIVRA